TLQTARVIDGKSIAQSIRSGIADEVSQMKEATGNSPGLALVLVGRRKDSHTFIRVKLKACDKVGIATLMEELPEECTEDELLRVVSRLNRDPRNHSDPADGGDCREELHDCDSVHRPDQRGRRRNRSQIEMRIKQGNHPKTMASRQRRSGQSNEGSHHSPLASIFFEQIMCVCFFLMSRSI
ncbi:hypothetical protein CRG98_013989, partial [Punica granatum]